VRAARDEALAVLDLARARKAARPDDAGARFEAAVALTTLGLAEQTGGDLVTPEARYREALSEHQLLAARDPSNAQWQRAIGVAADRMGSLMKARGDAKAALPWFLESDAASVRVAAIAPGNLEWQRDLFISAMALGRILTELGRLDEARAEIQRAVEVQERMRAMAPGTAREDRDLSVALLALGKVEVEARRAAAAEAALSRCIELLRRYFREVDTPAVRQDLALALLRLAKSKPRGTAAVRDIEEAVEILAPVRSLAAANPELGSLVREADKALLAEKRSRPPGKRPAR
jgi:tetratricopeptide (TPR) repeat protein